MTVSQMGSELFDIVASECKRWSERSLSVVRSLLVDGAPLSEVAAAHDMSSRQANVLLSRFLKKAEQNKIALFMAQEPPNILVKHEADINTLDKRGYSAQQIRRFLEKQGVKVSVKRIKLFMVNMEGEE
jgi:transposase-like protein